MDNFAAMLAPIMVAGVLRHARAGVPVRGRHA